MIRLEIHPGTGGADAEAFAGELTAAISRHSSTAAGRDGRVHTFHSL